MIRAFEKKDIDAVMRIWKNENIKVHDFISQRYWEDHYEYVREILPNAELYVFVQHEEIAGFIGLHNDYIEGIFVDEKSQGKGIGTVLLDTAKNSRDTLKLSVYKKNTSAVRFYKANGFVMTDEHEDIYTGEMEYRMIWNK